MVSSPLARCRRVAAFMLAAVLLIDASLSLPRFEHGENDAPFRTEPRTHILIELDHVAYWSHSSGFTIDGTPSAHRSQADLPAGEIFPQPAAANVGAPPRWKWGGQKRNYLPPAHVVHSADRMRARADFHKCHVGKRGARINDP